MLFGGYQPFTLSDYPGCIAAIAFTQGCNFRCVFCHNGSLLPEGKSGTGLYSAEDIMVRLRPRSSQLDGLVITGGEPTLHEDLPEFIAQVKALGLKLKLDTNGSRPDRLAALIQGGLVDYIAMDIKAPLHAYSRVCGTAVETAAIQESIALLGASAIPHHFRTTYSSAFLSEAELDEIRALVPKGSKHIVQRFQPEHALSPQLRGETKEA